jgi:hypothetical protein
MAAPIQLAPRADQTTQAAHGRGSFGFPLSAQPMSPEDVSKDQLCVPSFDMARVAIDDISGGLIQVVVGVGCSIVRSAGRDPRAGIRSAEIVLIERDF